MRDINVQALAARLLSIPHHADLHACLGGTWTSAAASAPRVMVGLGADNFGRIIGPVRAPRRLMNNCSAERERHKTRYCEQ